MEKTDGPSALVLSRQGLPVLDRSVYASAEGTRKGAYVLSDAKGDTPTAILIATGSEVPLALAAQSKLAEDGVDVRVVSMPSWELFGAQDAAYKEEVLPAAVTARLSIEAGTSFGWEKWTGSAGGSVSVDTFGASAPAHIIFENYGLTVDNVVGKTKELL